MIRFFNIILCLVFISIGEYAQASEQWQIVAERSKINFIGKSTLHDFNGTVGKISGGFEQNSNLAKGFIDVDISSLTTYEPERDKNMYQMFEKDLYPGIHFVFNDTDTSKILGLKNGEVEFKGVMTIHNISHPVTLISKGHMEDNTFICEGKAYIHLKDYRLKPPSILGLIHVNDEVVVQYNIVFINK